MHAKGVLLCERTCFCLLSTFSAPSMQHSLLRTLLRTLSLLKPLQAPSKNPSGKHLLLKSLLRTLLRSVLLHDPLGVHPQNWAATSSSIFYRIIRAGIGVFCLLGLTRVMFVSNMSDTTTSSLPPTPTENIEFATLYDTM